MWINERATAVMSWRLNMTVVLQATGHVPRPRSISALKVHRTELQSERMPPQAVLHRPWQVTKQCEGL